MTSLEKDALWDSLTHEWVESPTIGLSGGLLTTWDTSKFTLLSSKSEFNWIWVRGITVGDTAHANNYVNIYAPHRYAFKEILGNKLQVIMDTYPNESFFLLGDFNSIRGPMECQNYGYRQKDSSWLNSIIINNNLWDVPLTNYQITWFGPNGKCSKLDRALIKCKGHTNTNWTLRGVGRKSSDHVGLLLSEKEQINWGPKPTKPFNIWLKEPDFIQFLQEKMATTDTLNRGVHSKLRNFRKEIQAWNTTKNVRLKKRIHSSPKIEK